MIAGILGSQEFYNDDGGVYDLAPDPTNANGGIFTNLNGNPVNGLQLAQFYGIAYNPNNATSPILGGIQDNGLIYQTAGYVTALYQYILDRAPDSGGDNFWVNALNSGITSPAAVAMAFLTSTEYRQDLVAGAGWTPTGGQATPGRFYAGYYLTYLLRQGDAGGVASWVAALQGGATDQQVLAGILGSTEFYNDGV